METWLYIGAALHLSAAMAHLAFWKIFRWKQELPFLSPMNQGIMQVLNLRMIYVFCLFAFLSSYFATELLVTYLGQSLLVGISLFWWFRAFEQMLFFPQREALTWVMLCGFCAIGTLYFIPLVMLHQAGALLLRL